MPTTVAEQAANGKVFSRCFSGTGATARFSRPHARTVTERRFCTGREPPARGADGRAEGCRSWRRGGGNGGAGKVYITPALCKSGSEGSPSGATLAGTGILFSRCFYCKGRDRRATADKSALIGRAERERLYPRRSDRSPGAGGGDPEHGRAGGIGIGPGTRNGWASSRALERRRGPRRLVRGP